MGDRLNRVWGQFCFLGYCKVLVYMVEVYVSDMYNVSRFEIDCVFGDMIHSGESVSGG